MKICELILEQNENFSNSNSITLYSTKKIKEGFVQVSSNIFFYKTIKMILYKDCLLELIEDNYKVRISFKSLKD